ncbi:hypothetical protein H9P43_008108 [Blastocladiella emersonii ATCC 22665]|nr:hypothetical protein H9P43_008108 [Blastocladiella emersonii ATCC 22665]
MKPITRPDMLAKCCQAHSRPPAPAPPASSSLAMPPPRLSRDAQYTLDVGVQLPFGGANFDAPVDVSYRVARYAVQYGIERALRKGMMPKTNVTLHVVDTYHYGNPSSRATMAADMLISKNVKAVVGDGTSPSTMNAAGLYGFYGIPLCSPFASNPSLSNKNMYPTFFRTLPSIEVLAKSLVTFLNKMDWKRVGMFYDEADPATLMKFRSVLSAANSMGIATTFQSVAKSTSSLCAQIQRSDTRILLAQSDDWVAVFQALETCQFFDGNHVLIGLNNFNDTLAAYMTKSPFAALYKNSSSHILEADLPQPAYGYLADEFLETLPKTDFPFKDLDMTLDDVKLNAANVDLVIGCAYVVVAGWDKHRVHHTEHVTPDLLPLTIKLEDFNATMIEGVPFEVSTTGDWVPEYFIIRGVSYLNATFLDFTDYAQISTENCSLSQVEPWRFAQASIPVDGPQPTLANPTWDQPVSIFLAVLAGLDALFVIAITAWMLRTPPHDMPRENVAVLGAGCVLMLLVVPLMQGIPTALICTVRPIAFDAGFGLVLSAVYSWLYHRYLVFDTSRPLRGASRGPLWWVIFTCLSLIAFKQWAEEIRDPVAEMVGNNKSVYYRCVSANRFIGVLVLTIGLYAGLIVHGLFMAAKLRFDSTASRMGVLLINAVLVSISIPISIMLVVPLVAQLRSLYMAFTSPIIVFAPFLFQATRALAFRVRHRRWKLTTAEINRFYGPGSSARGGGGLFSSTSSAAVEPMTSSAARTEKSIPAHQALMTAFTAAAPPSVPVQRRTVQQWSVPYALKWSGFGLLGRRSVYPARVLLTRKILTIEWRDRVFSEHVAGILIRRQPQLLVESLDDPAGPRTRGRSGSLGSLFRTGNLSSSASQAPTSVAAAAGPRSAAAADRSVPEPRTARARAGSLGAIDVHGRTRPRPPSILTSRAMLSPTSTSPSVPAIPEHDIDDLDSPVGGDEESGLPAATHSPRRLTTMDDDPGCLRVESLDFCFFLQFASAAETLTFCTAMKDRGCEGCAIACNIGGPAALESNAGVSSSPTSYTPITLMSVAEATTGRSVIDQQRRTSAASLAIGPRPSVARRGSRSVADSMPGA